MPIALASWATSFRRSSNREAAPEKSERDQQAQQREDTSLHRTSADTYLLRTARHPADANAPADFLEQEHAEKHSAGKQQRAERAGHDHRCFTDIVIENLLLHGMNICANRKVLVKAGYRVVGRARTVGIPATVRKSVRDTGLTIRGLSRPVRLR